MQPFAKRRLAMLPTVSGAKWIKFSACGGRLQDLDRSAGLGHGIGAETSPDDFVSQEGGAPEPTTSRGSFPRGARA